MKIAENIKKFRERQGMSQKELAQTVGVNQSMIAHIENGLRIPSLAVSLELAEALNTTVDELCKGA
ncbi:MAG: helix-turn-helix transcriptional regulator [Ruminococcus sp.]